MASIYLLVFIVLLLKYETLNTIVGFAFFVLYINAVIQYGLLCVWHLLFNIFVLTLLRKSFTRDDVARTVL